MIKALAIAKNVIQINICLNNNTCNNCDYNSPNNICKATYITSFHIDKRIRKMIIDYCEKNCECILAVGPYCSMSNYIIYLSNRKKGV